MTEELRPSLQPLQSWATWTDPSSACFQSIVEAWCQRPQREREGRGGRDGGGGGGGGGDGSRDKIYECRTGL